MNIISHERSVLSRPLQAFTSTACSCTVSPYISVSFSYIIAIRPYCPLRFPRHRCLKQHSRTGPRGPRLMFRAAKITLEIDFRASLWSIPRPFDRKDFSYTGGALTPKGRIASQRALSTRGCQAAKLGRVESRRIYTELRLTILLSARFVYFLCVNCVQVGGWFYVCRGRVLTPEALWRHSYYFHLYSVHRIAHLSDACIARERASTRVSISERFDCCGERRINFNRDSKRVAYASFFAFAPITIVFINKRYGSWYLFRAERNID